MVALDKNVCRRWHLPPFFYNLLQRVVGYTVRPQRPSILPYSAADTRQLQDHILHRVSLVSDDVCHSVDSGNIHQLTPIQLTVLL